MTRQSSQQRSSEYSRSPTHLTFIGTHYFIRYNVACDIDLAISLLITMSLPLCSYFLSPLNPRTKDNLEKHDWLLNVHNVEVQAARLADISVTFRVALRDQSKSSLLLLAESLRSNTREHPLKYDTDMKVEQLSVLHTISFTNPRLDLTRDGDFCVYFALESNGPETFATDLALFIRTLGRELIEWSVHGNPNRLDPGDPAHPTLQDIAYSWDGVTCAFGVLQFSANPVSAMNIDRIFHRTSRILFPLCPSHRYEYFANGIFAHVERAVLLSVFTEMEVAAQELCDNHALFVDATDNTKRLPY